jgi:peptidoglycan hydrolase CwlO-like protein
MLKKTVKFLKDVKTIIWAIVLSGTVLIFIYGTYLKVSETVPTKVYAMERDLNDVKYRVTDLETEKLIINKDLSVMQTELKEIKAQIAENQKETRAALKEINRDVKDILKTI